MLKLPLTRLARIFPAFVLCSCAAPKAEIVKEAPVRKTKPTPTVATIEPATHKKPDDGIRLPNMLDLPAESEFRSTRPAAPSHSTGAVIARPPSETPPNP